MLFESKITALREEAAKHPRHFRKDGWVHRQYQYWINRRGKDPQLNTCPFIRGAALGALAQVWDKFIMRGPKLFGVRIPVVPMITFLAALTLATLKYTNAVVTASIIIAAAAYLVGLIFAFRVVFNQVGDLGFRQPRKLERFLERHESAWTLFLPLWGIPLLALVAIGTLMVAVFGPLFFLFSDLKIQDYFWKWINVHPKKLPWLRPTLLLLIPAGILANKYPGWAIRIGLSVMFVIAVVGVLILAELLRDRRNAKRREDSRKAVEAFDARVRDELTRMFNHRPFREWLDENNDYEARHFKRIFEIELDTEVADIFELGDVRFRLEALKLDFMQTEAGRAYFGIEDDADEEDTVTTSPPVKVKKRRVRKFLKRRFDGTIEVITAILLLIGAAHDRSICRPIILIEDAPAPSEAKEPNPNATPDQAEAKAATDGDEPQDATESTKDA